MRTAHPMTVPTHMNWFILQMMSKSTLSVKNETTFFFPGLQVCAALLRRGHCGGGGGLAVGIGGEISDGGAKVA